MLRKKLYETGIGIEAFQNEDTRTKSLLLKINNVQIAKVNLNLKEIAKVNNDKTIKENEIYTTVKNLLLTKYTTPAGIIESFPEPIINNNDMWFYKKITLFLEKSNNENQLITDINKVLSEKFINNEIKISKESENTNGFNIYIDNKQVLSIYIQNFSDNLHRENTSSLQTSLSTRFPFRKYIDEYFEPVAYLVNEHNNTDKNNLTNDNESIATSNKKNSKPKIAIILDDGGYRNPEEDPALELNNKINISILPDTKYTKELAEKAREKGFEVMLHMPMQTRQGVTKGSLPCELLITMSEKEIKEKTKEAIKQIPGVKGVNNHTGGVFTLKEEPLKYFMKVLKEEDLFFIDSIVIGGSKAYKVAVETGVPSLQRDIFLDHEYTTAKIKASLEELKKIAQKKGQAIGIGHFRDLTINVLKEELPKLEEQGFELVRVSELLE